MKVEWILELPHFGKLRISNELIKELQEFQQLDPKAKESGGLLIGKHLNSGGAMLIDGFTPPQPSDKQSRNSFYRSKAHNSVVQKVWSDSNHRSTYAGLWHTHPEGIPSYSPADKKDWLNALSSSQYDGDHLIFLIVGITHISCWLGKAQNLQVELAGKYKL